MELSEVGERVFAAECILMRRLRKVSMWSTYQMGNRSTRPLTNSPSSRIAPLLGQFALWEQDKYKLMLNYPWIHLVCTLDA